MCDDCSAWEKYEGPIKAGDRVRHYGTKRWATVQEVHSRGKNSAELLVQPDKALLEEWENKPAWWATYHIMTHESVCPKWEPKYINVEPADDVCKNFELIEEAVDDTF